MGGLTYDNRHLYRSLYATVRPLQQRVSDSMAPKCEYISVGQPHCRREAFIISTPSTKDHVGKEAISTPWLGKN
jgi:hypothetical protein